jgi:hypothetical protein
MNQQIQVLFYGMCLWWLPATGERWALLPDLSNAKVPHTASLYAPPSSFADGKCPERFRLQGQNCVFNLNENGAPGGVEIAFLTNQAASRSSDVAFCEIPHVAGPTAQPYRLRPSHIPPKGNGNAAWMEAVGGTPIPTVEQCCDPGEECPRIVQWTVPASNQSNVVLSLSNVKTAGAPKAVLAQLADNATISVVNEPPDDIKSARRASHATHAMERVVGKDWCLYAEMLETKDGKSAPCVQPIVDPCPSPVVGKKIPCSMTRDFFTTIACSNSQYP